MTPIRPGLTARSFTLAMLLGMSWASAAAPGPSSDAGGILPVDEWGESLNLDFEAGDLRDWTAEGEAFAGQPIEGDTVAARRGDMRSRHQGRFWVGSYEVFGDRPRGNLTSKPFRVTRPFARFLVGGGRVSARVELVRRSDGQVIVRVMGDDVEDMKPVAVDLSGYLGAEIFIRLVDDRADGWGHVNFDDFRLFETEPDAPSPLRPDAYAHAGLTPDEAARAMTVPEGFRVDLIAGEPDVVQPIAFTFDTRGRLWVAEAYSYPFRAPEGEGRDRILIFEDADADGRFETRKVFAEGLNLVSGLEVGFGGVWVGAAPEFLFLADLDGNDRPDGPPRVLLDGWGYQDTHETLNSFNWGPDGWLYGCHGVFTHSRVGTPGTPDDQRVPINAGIWRYHPTRHVFEVFADGTSNPWGIDFDDLGRAFETACVIPHLYQMIPGGRYERQAGPHFNPYTYDDIKTIADHRHWLGDRPHAGNNKSDAAGGGHAHAGALIYLGGAWPEEYRGSLLMNNIHGARINRDRLEPEGSGFVGKHAPDLLRANDSWSQIVSLRTGPDGQVYMIDWYDKNQCHVRKAEVHDRTNGRIFRVAYGDSKPARVDLAALGSSELVALQLHPNEWFVRQARRVLQGRGPDPEVRRLVRSDLLTREEPARRLRGLWTLHAACGLDEVDVDAGLADPSPNVRAWTIRLLMERGEPSSSRLDQFAGMARNDPSPVVRLGLASALQRLPLGRRWEVLAALVEHAEDADDHNLPLMDWYAAEPLAEADPSRALDLALNAKVPVVRAFLFRRVAAIGTPEVANVLIEVLRRIERAGDRLAALREINAGLAGHGQIAMPRAWPDLFEAIVSRGDPATRSQATALGLSFGDPKARAALRGVLADDRAGLAVRREALEALVQVHDPELPPTLRGLLDADDLRRPALRGLAAFDDPETPRVVLDAYAGFDPEARRDALNTLATRPESARALLAAVEAGEVRPIDLSADIVRQVRNLRDDDLDARIARTWGAARDTSADKADRIAKLRARLGKKPDHPPDLRLGRSVFARTCQQCHVIFGEGGQVGPELTGSNRADLDYILANILDPSALIGKDYQAHVLALADGRVLTGIVRAEDPATLTLLTANETLTLPKAEIEERRPSEASMMPDDLLATLSDHQVRSLIAYLASPAQVPLPEPTEGPGDDPSGRDAQVR